MTSIDQMSATFRESGSLLSVIDSYLLGLLIVLLSSPDITKMTIFDELNIHMQVFDRY